MTASLRAFFEQLRRDGDILTVSREVDPEFELNAVVRAIQAGPNRPVIFNRVKGYRYPVISNALGNYATIARVLGVPITKLARRWSELTSEGKAPETLHESSSDDYEDISLDDVPHITFSEKDAGPYLTASVLVAQDPDTKVTNLSYHRMQIVSGSELRCRLSTSGDLYRLQQSAEARGESLPAVVAIGLPPALMLAAATTIGPSSSEYDLAAKISGKRFPLAMVGGVPVPSSTEFLIEGEILPTVRQPEGPFGEWMDYYTPVTPNHVFRVRRVKARKNAMFYAISAGSLEELSMTAVPIAGSIYNGIRTWVPGVRDVACFPLLQFCVVQICNTSEGQAQRAALAAFGAEMNRVLYCIVVDEDVDIHNWSDVLWALATRCRPDRDVFTVPGVPSFARDPHKMHWGRLAFDATKPIAHAADFERKQVPGLQNLDLGQYL